MAKFFAAILYSPDLPRPEKRPGLISTFFTGDYFALDSLKKVHRVERGRGFTVTSGIYSAFPWKESILLSISAMVNARPSDSGRVFRAGRRLLSLSLLSDLTLAPT